MYDETKIYNAGDIILRLNENNVYETLKSLQWRILSPVNAKKRYWGTCLHSQDNNIFIKFLSIRF